MASSHPWFNIVYALPLFIGFFKLGYSWFISDLMLTLIFVFVGFVYWSFIEYGIHRWIYHGHYKNKKIKSIIESFHIYHHRNPTDHEVLTAGPLMIYPLTVILLTPVWIISGFHNGALASVALGLLSYYLFYEWVHFSIHRRNVTSRYMKWITSYHLTHHEKWHSKFGNTTSLWDHLLGTFDKRKLK